MRNNRKVKNSATIFVLVFIGIIGGFFLFNSSALCGGEDKAQKNSEKSQNDISPLVGVVIGGLIGVGGGAVVFLLQSRHEQKVFKRTKLEELAELACQCDDWLDKLLLSYLVQGDISATIEKFPINHMRMIQALYFPMLKNEVEALSQAVKDFRNMAIMERENLRKTEKYSPKFKEQYDPKQKLVLNAIEALLKKASGIKI